MTFSFETERESDGRWIAEVRNLPGVLSYGSTENQAKTRVQALALRVAADQLEHGEATAGYTTITFVAYP
jgi:predicted RNase H-like HicB family nuclease